SSLFTVYLYPQISILSLHDALPIYLLGLFYHKVSRRVSDRAGKVLEEQIGKVENLALKSYTEEAILASAAGARMTRKFSYQYERDRKSTRLNSSHQIISYAVF